MYEWVRTIFFYIFVATLSIRIQIKVYQNGVHSFSIEKQAIDGNAIFSPLRARTQKSILLNTNE